MQDISFRQARFSDLAAIVALLAADELGKDRETVSASVDDCYISAFQAIEADTNQELVVVVQGNDVVGTLQLSYLPGLARRGSWRGQIEAVRISETLRGAGLGQRMIEWAIDRCKARGCTLVQLTSDKKRADAHRFYERLGFVASHEGYKLTLANT
ncbi:MAG: GNAT family N-acetyltransferase [Rhizomicrobium sp.]|jgi:GNAT superfamily N-acetyltransferase